MTVNLFHTSFLSSGSIWHSCLAGDICLCFLMIPLCASVNWLCPRPADLINGASHIKLLPSSDFILTWPKTLFPCKVMVIGMGIRILPWVCVCATIQPITRGMLRTSRSFPLHNEGGTWILEFTYHTHNTSETLRYLTACLGLWPGWHILQCLESSTRGQCVILFIFFHQLTFNAMWNQLY